MTVPTPSAIGILGTGSYWRSGAACVPITLHATVRGIGVRPGQPVLLAGFGGGMSIGAAMLRWATPVQAHRVAWPPGS